MPTPGFKARPNEDLEGLKVIEVADSVLFAGLPPLSRNSLFSSDVFDNRSGFRSRFASPTLLMPSQRSPTNDILRREYSLSTVVIGDNIRFGSPVIQNKAEKKGRIFRVRPAVIKQKEMTIKKSILCAQNKELLNNLLKRRVVLRRGLSQV